MKRVIILISIILVFLSILPSCKKSSEAPGSVFPPENPAPGVYRGNIAINFTEMDSTDTPITLESLRGNVILLTFSTMWCGPCRREAPELVNLYNTYNQNGLEIVQCIYQDEDGNPADLDDLARWINEFGITFPVFYDPDRSTVDTYNFNAIPFNVLIDRNFIIWHRIEGYDPDELRRLIEELL